MLGLCSSCLFVCLSVYFQDGGRFIHYYKLLNFRMGFDLFTTKVPKVILPDESRDGS